MSLLERLPPEIAEAILMRLDIDDLAAVARVSLALKARCTRVYLRNNKMQDASSYRDALNPYNRYQSWCSPLAVSHLQQFMCDDWWEGRTRKPRRR